MNERGRDVAAIDIERIFREENGRVLAILIGALGDFDLAEDALQEAFVTALERWPRDGVPDNPAAWMVTVGRRKAIDRLRREKVLVDKTAILSRLLPTSFANPALIDDTEIPDERLKLIF